MQESIGRFGRFAWEAVTASVREHAWRAPRVAVFRAIAFETSRRLSHASRAARGLQRARKTPCYTGERETEGSRACIA